MGRGSFHGGRQAVIENCRQPRAAAGHARRSSRSSLTASLCWRLQDAAKLGKEKAALQAALTKAQGEAAALASRLAASQAELAEASTALEAARGRSAMVEKAWEKASQVGGAGRQQGARQQGACQASVACVMLPTAGGLVRAPAGWLPVRAACVILARFWGALPCRLQESAALRSQQRGLASQLKAAQQENRSLASKVEELQVGAPASVWRVLSVCLLSWGGGVPGMPPALDSAAGMGPELGMQCRARRVHLCAFRCAPARCPQSLAGVASQSPGFVAAGPRRMQPPIVLAGPVGAAGACAEGGN